MTRPDVQKKERLLGIARDNYAAGRLAESVVSTIMCLEYRAELTSAELVDLLERACVYGPLDLVQVVYEQLGPFAYRGWALALSLRVAREDVARYLLAQGVDLLEDVEVPELWRAIAAHESSLSRFDLTRSSPNLFLNPLEHTVCTEVFAPFFGTDQLMGSSYATSCDLAATCDLVGRLAEEGFFDSVVFDDLFRAALVRAQELMGDPSDQPPYAKGALLALAARMLDLRRGRGMGSDYIDLIMGNLIRPAAEEELVAFVCEHAPRVFLGRLMALSWLRDRAELVRRMVPHLARGIRCPSPSSTSPSPAPTEEQEGTLLCLLARNGYLEELREVAAWPAAATRRNLEAAIAEASRAGRAEAASWLLAWRRSLDEDAADGDAADGGDAIGLGSLADLAL